jgi:shikimate kinase
VEYAEKFLHHEIAGDQALSIKVNSDIPSAIGLKSSSAISVAVVTAVVDLLGHEDKKNDPKQILQLACGASKSSKASLTGAFDDAISCMLGGLALADNTRYRVVRHMKVPKELGSIALIRIPLGHKVYTSTIKKTSYSKFSKKHLMDAFNLAKAGDIQGAMLLNSLVQCSVLGYSFEPISSAMFEGATCAGLSGKGPAIAALCSSEKIAERIENRWKSEDNERHSLKISKTKVLQTPKEFLPID